MVDDATIIDLQNDIDDIKKELGLTPQGVYADVRVRLDILESRIGTEFAQATDVANPFFVGNDGISISTGNGVPIENRINGSLFLRKDGDATDGVYTRQGNSWFPVGSAVAATFQATAGGNISKGQALRTTTDGDVIVATTNLRSLPFDCVSKAGAVNGSLFDIQVAGPLDPGVVNLGAGVACAVGADASGNLVRATDPTCVSTPNWIGTCDALGNITVALRRENVLNALDFGLKNDDATDNSPLFSALMDLLVDKAASTLYFPPGIYRFNSRIGAPFSLPGAIPMGLRILGATPGGAFHQTGATIFDFYNAGTAIRAWHDIVPRTLGAGVSIEKIRMRGRLTTGAPTITLTSSSGSPSVTIKGKNGTALNIKVKTIAGGVLGVATFQYSLDNGSTWSSTITTPVHTFGPSFAVPFLSTRLGTTELHLNFPPGTYQAADATYTTASVPASDFSLASPTTGPTITVTGDSAENYTGRIRISTAGTVGVLGGESAYFQLSMDGGSTWGTAQPIYAEVILFPTGHKARFAAGTYVLNEVYPPWTATIPNYNRIGVEIILGAEIAVKDCVITGFKYSISNDGSELTTIDHVSSTAIESEASAGYQDLISDIGIDSAVGIRYVTEVSSVSGNTNNHIVQSCQFSASMFGTLHEDGVGHFVRDSNYEVPGAIALLKGGQQVLFENLTSEGANKGGFYCRRGNNEGNAAVYLLTLKNIDFVGRANVPLINIDGFMGITGLSVDGIQAQASPVTGAIRHSELISGAWVGVVSVPFGTPIMDNYENQLSGVVGRTINHNTLAHAALDVGVVDFTAPSYRFSLSPTKVYNERKHTANNGGIDSSSDRVFHQNTARCSGEDAKAIEHAVFVAGVSTANLAAFTPTIQFGSGQVWVTVQAVRPNDTTKMASWRIRQKFHNPGSGFVLLGSPTIEYAEDLDGSFVAPTILVSGGSFVAHVQAHPTQDIDVSAKVEVLGVGF